MLRHVFVIDNRNLLFQGFCSIYNFFDIAKNISIIYNFAAVFALITRHTTNHNQHFAKVNGVGCNILLGLKTTMRTVHSCCFLTFKLPYQTFGSG